MGELQVSFQYCEDCPSHEQALERLQRVLREEGVRVKLEVVDVQTDEQAKHLHFIGSPTILIESKDIDPPSDSSYSAGACRVYKLDDGRISPLPSEDMIRRAVRAAMRIRIFKGSNQIRNQ